MWDQLFEKVSESKAATESFPRMWDQLGRFPRLKDISRIIPTYVGSTPGLIPLILQNSNHSHVCGINALFYRIRNYVAESFPRMWDQPPLPLQSAFRKRIIPTYVGSTHDHNDHGIFIANHSHVCGINAFSKFVILSPSESFPRMWDQLKHFTHIRDGRRIIPTYVGSTWRSLSAVCSCANHSHVCGINREFPPENRGRNESFPRMWDQH